MSVASLDTLEPNREGAEIRIRDQWDDHAGDGGRIDGNHSNSTGIHSLSDQPLNDLDRYHLVSDIIDRVPGLAARAAYAQQAIREKLIEHKQYIAKYGEDMPDIRDWTWSPAMAGKRRRGKSPAGSRKKRA